MATVQEVAIDPDIHETGGAERLISDLEDELSRRGISVMEGAFNGYSDRIAKEFSESITEERQEGSGKFLKIDLTKPRKTNVAPFPSRS